LIEVVLRVVLRRSHHQLTHPTTSADPYLKAYGSDEASRRTVLRPERSLGQIHRLEAALRQRVARRRNRLLVLRAFQAPVHRGGFLFEPVRFRNASEDIPVVIVGLVFAQSGDTLNNVARASEGLASSASTAARVCMMGVDPLFDNIMARLANSKVAGVTLPAIRVAQTSSL
jgi:hypothetical protein